MKRLSIIAIFLFAPVMVFGAVSSVKFQGQKLSSSDVAIYREFELRAGDVIISYDDKVLTSPKDAMELYDKIRAGKLSKLLIERDGHYELITRSSAK